VQQQQQQEQQQKVLSKQKTAKRAAVQQRQRQPRLSVARLLQPLAQPAPLALQAPARQDISSTAAMVCEHVHQGRSVLLSAGDASAVSKALYVAAAARVLQQARHGSSLALQPSWLGAPPAAPTSPAPATSTKHSKHQQQQQQQQQQQVAAAGLQLQVMPAAEHLLRYRPGNTLQATRQPGSWGRLVTPLAAQLQSGGSATLRAAGAGALHNALAAAAAVRQRFQAQGADLALVPRYQVMSHAEWRAGSKAGRAAAAAELVAEGVAGPVPDDDEDADEPFSAMLLQVVLVAPVQQQQQWQQQQRRARKPGRSKSRAQGTPAGVTAEAAAVEQLPGRQPPAVVLQRELVLAA
jgi:stage V sporulation protein SpoVS